MGAGRCAKVSGQPTLLGYLNKAYTLTGQTDSVVAVTNRLMAKDTTEVVPALSAAKALIDAKRPKEAVPFLDFAIKHGDPQAKENAAALLYTGAAPLLQQPQDLLGAAELLRMAVSAANPAGKVQPAANYLLGLATLFQVPQIDPRPRSRSRATWPAGGDAPGRGRDGADGRPRGQSGGGRQEPRYHQAVQARVASMLKAYCK